MGIRKPSPRPFLRRRSVRLGAAALVLAAAGVALSVRHDRAVERNRALADQALDRLDLPAAAGHLRDYLADRPDNADAHFLLARTLRRDGKFDDAGKQLAEARRLGWDPDAVGRETFLIDLQRSGVRQRSTDDLLAMVGDANPDRVLLETLYRGDVAIQNWDRAAYWLHLWLTSYPDDWPPRLWQAEVLERFRKYDQARADYLRVLELRPDQPRALLGVGQVALAHRADYAEAESYLGRYLAIDPGHAGARLGMALCRYGRGDLAGAREAAQGVLADHPRDPGAALLLGSIEAEAGRDEEAIRWLRVAEAGGADPQGVCYQLAQVLRRAGQTVEADRYERRFIELRDAQRALEAATQAADQEPTSAARQYEVGRLYLVLGSPDVAAGWFLKALAQDPAHRPSHAALADYYARRGDPR
ncbi:MAG TPA: tetratricopeptide repeat protein, partial [Fimbriiglobus sp.]|nr:tetratricopeptide repeat protein [Fimbriiglobus sp.]